MEKEPDPKAEPQPNRFVVFEKPRGQRITTISQRLLIRERMLAVEIHELQKESAEIRADIRRALESGAKLEPGLRRASIELRQTLKIR